jgi:hypothetical protein
MRLQFRLSILVAAVVKDMRIKVLQRKDEK